MSDLVKFLERQKGWSEVVFGLGPRLGGISKHIEKEINEVRHAYTPEEELGEWIDIVILALDGAWRAGFTPEQVVAELQRKQEENFKRNWPPPGPQDEPNEHVRSHP